MLERIRLSDCTITECEHASCHSLVHTKSNIKSPIASGCESYVVAVTFGGHTKYLAMAFGLYKCFRK